MASPKNIVHISQNDITNGRIKHVTQAEISEIAANTIALSAVSFKDSLVVSAATTTGKFLTFTHNGVDYALPLYEI